MSDGNTSYAAIAVLNASDSTSDLPPPPPTNSGNSGSANKPSAESGLEMTATVTNTADTTGEQDDNISEEDEDDEDGSDDDADATASKNRSRPNSFIDSRRLSIVVEDLKRGNLWKLCYDITCWYGFWIFVTILILSEPIIVSWNHHILLSLEYIIIWVIFIKRLKIIQNH